MIAAALEPLQRSGIADRCELVGGDFFSAVPSGADVYLLKSVVHDWADEEAIAILRTCRAAMMPTSKLLLVERVIVGPPYPVPTAMSDLNMLVGPGGQERTQEEYAQLLAKADLQLTTAVPTASGFWVMQAQLA